MEQAHNIKVNLPAAVRAAADFKPGMVNIAVDTNGAVWLERKPVTLPELRLVLSNRFRLDTNLPVYVSGDAGVLQGAVSDVLLTVRNVGVQTRRLHGPRHPARSGPPVKIRIPRPPQEGPPGNHPFD